MHTWQKSIKRISLPVRWMAGGAILVLLALIGLSALAPINYEPPQPMSFISFFLSLVFEIGLVTLIISSNCWFNLKLSHLKPKAHESFAGQNNPILPGPVQEMASNEQYARSTGWPAIV